ncbi:type II secretion system protein [Paraglaciecola sp.]|uniref:PilW family protein n=1 Tax=Paraglaciecola sp. TaxID=1920173 RepID=UPI0030F494CA
MSKVKLAAAKGFTLIELITVIIVLGVVSIGIAGFLRGGFQIYADATERQQILTESRFVVERLNRELRMAIPNSVRLIDDLTLEIQCIEFVPAEWVSFYTTLPVSTSTLPASPSVSTQARIVELPNNRLFSLQLGDFAFVSPTDNDDIYLASEQKRQTVLACSDALDGDGNPDGDGDCNTADSKSHTAELTLSGAFADESPASRMYFGRRIVSFCARTEGGKKGIYRHQGNITTKPTLYDTGGDLMAQHLRNDLSENDQLPFAVSSAVLNRNGLVHMVLAFELNEEPMNYSIEVHIPNVP